MKSVRIGIISLLLFSQFVGKAQTLSEWTQQKQTQIKYLIEQVAAHKVYLDGIYKGYKIAGQGLNLIRKIKKGDFDLHEGFITSLKIINPKISTYSLVGDLIELQASLEKDMKLFAQSLHETNFSDPEGLDLVKTAIARIKVACLKKMEDLFLILSPGELDMTDDQRILHIDRIYLDLQETKAHWRSFADNYKIVRMQKFFEKNEINLLIKLYGLK